MTAAALLTNERCLMRLRNGDVSARGEVIAHACNRLRRLAASLLRDEDRLRRWVDSDDVLQTAVLRLMRSLEAVTPESAEHFFRLAATHMRRELIDLARHYYGPHGAGANEQPAAPPAPVSASADVNDPAGSVSGDPQRLSEWTALHERIESMPVEERCVCELIWYHGLTQAEAGKVLNLNEAKVRRCWAAARLKLRQAMRDELPPT